MVDTLLRQEGVDASCCCCYSDWVVVGSIPLLGPYLKSCYSSVLHYEQSLSYVLHK